MRPPRFRLWMLMVAVALVGAFCAVLASDPLRGFELAARIGAIVALALPALLILLGGQRPDKPT